MTRVDRSNGYERMAREFMRGRQSDGIGAAIVRDWTRTIRRGGAVLDLGCGHGLPISQVLVDAGFEVYGVDASPAMLARFKDSDFFARTFDGVVAWGLMFLLPPAAQALVIGKVSRSLARGGRLLFTSPYQACTWTDILTGAQSVSLGRDRYRQMLEAEGLELEQEKSDEGDNHYYFASKG
jgi:SAM-dependent methyltransferase